jgi:hypothetical protein
MRLVLTQSISQKLEIGLRQYLTETRAELAQTLRGEKFEPSARCPKCSRKLTAVEILKGFNDNPTDFTTACPKCGERFPASLINYGRVFRTELQFYCARQVVEQLRGFDHFTPEEISRANQSVFQSAIYHFGSLRQAFEKIDRTYSFDEVGAWREKIQPFLGRLPDTIIAECVDVPVSAIRYMRRKLEIPCFRFSDIES